MRSHLFRSVRAWLFDAHQMRVRPVRGARSQNGVAAHVLTLESRQLLSGGTTAESPAAMPAALNLLPVVQSRDFTIYENSANGAFIGTISASNSTPNETLTFSIDAGNTNNAFTINAVTGVLSVNSSTALNFETTPKFTLTIKATDNGSPQQFGAATVTVALLNVNEPPTMPSRTATIAENSPIGSAVTIMAGTDPDMDKLSYSIVGGNAKNTFAINPNTGAVTVNDPKLLDYENASPFVLTVLATDNGAPPLATSAQLIVYLSNVDEGPPVVSPQNFSIGENSLDNAFIGTISAKNPDTYQTHRFAITAGNINDAFAIDPDTGVLSVKHQSALDFETIPHFQLTIMATETTAPGQSGSGVVTVFLRDVNEAPTVVTPKVVALTENSVVGTVVATVNVADPDAGQSFTYAITGGNTLDAFVINPQTGVITVANSAALDYENRPPFDLTIEVKDNGQPVLSGEGTLKIVLKNANDAPLLYAASVKLAENSAVGTTVLDYKIVAKDQDVGQALSYSITAGNTKNAFKIDAATGVISVNNSAALDFETNPAFTLTIAVTDNGVPVLMSSAKLTVNLTNVNETPVLLPQSFAVKTFSATGTVVGKVKSSDPDAGQTRTYSIVSGNGVFNNLFAIDATSGNITVNNAARLLFPGQFSLVIKVTDSGSPSLSATATMTIDVNSTGTVPNPLIASVKATPRTLTARSRFLS